MKRIILGTAGHIDHGKTALVKALTGTDCDRLKEEKQRGITIELGFASLTLPGGQAVGIVDVPGHEKFIKNMVAGTGGIDAVMLVIAADEGIMPQTREHLDICRLLAVRQGIIVLTKADLADADWLGLVTQDVRDFVRGSFLENAPAIAVSSVTGAGLDQLRSAIEAMVASIAERPPSGIFRMPVDRVFTMKGFGTVLTGTPLAGLIGTGDEIELLPGGMRAKVRGIQVHNQPAGQAAAGMRTALNVQGIEKAAVERGWVAASPGVLATTIRVGAWLDHLETAPQPLKHRTRVRLHAGTAEIPATVILLEADELAPGTGGYVQLVLDEPAVLLPRDRYVIRSFSPIFTIGGGEILDNGPPRLKRFLDSSRQHLETLRSGTAESVLLLVCREAGLRGSTLEKLTARLGMAGLQKQIEELRAAKKIIVYCSSPLQITVPEIAAGLEKAIVAALDSYHRAQPLKPGPVRDELLSLVPRATDARLFGWVLDAMGKSGKIKISNEFFSLPGYKAAPAEDAAGLSGSLLALYKKGAATPPTRKEVLEQLKAPVKDIAALLGLLVRQGLLCKIDEELYYEMQALESLIEKTRELAAKTNGEITLAGFKEATGLSRKFMIPLLEYFDKTKLTLRVGDKRVLRKTG